MRPSAPTLSATALAFVALLTMRAAAADLSLEVNADVTLSDNAASFGSRSVNSTLNLNFDNSALLCFPDNGGEQANAVSSDDGHCHSVGAYSVRLSANKSTSENVLINFEVLQDGKSLTNEPSRILVKIGSRASVAIPSQNGSPSVSLSFVPRI